uniref:Uncharacterized protein n=1 Tax=Anguilla anguilla TaxID=7936 RepID=A0A0E9VX05_ANGAN
MPYRLLTPVIVHLCLFP